MAVVIGPELGSVPSFLVEQAMRHCYKRGYDDLVVAGFSFDAMAQEAIQDNNEDKNTDLRIHMAQIGRITGADRHAARGFRDPVCCNAA